MLDSILTVAFIASIIYSVYQFAKDVQILCLFAGLFIYVALASRAVSWVSTKLCYFMERTLFVGHRNAHVFEEKPKAIKKIKDQCWQLFLHLSSIIFELPVMLSHSWWKDPTSCFSPCPCKQIPDFSLKCMYAFEAAAYIYDGIAHRFWNERKHDYFVMFAHHIVTALLISGSYAYNYFAFGAVVMFLHDISDVPVDMLIICNQMRVEGKEWFFIVEIQYCVTTLTWFVFRNVMFALKLLMPLREITKLDDCFADSGKTMFNILQVLLYSLYAMHFYWLYAFLRIGYDILTMPIEKNRGVTYEGKEDPKED